MTSSLTYSYERATANVAAAVHQLAQSPADGPAMLFVEDSSPAGTACAVVRWPDRDLLLADAVHTFEHFGLRLGDHCVLSTDETSQQAHRFVFVTPQEWTANSPRRVEAVFDAYAQNRTVIDGYSRLAVVAEVTVRDIALVRAAARFARQTGLAMSERYVIDTLCRHAGFVEALVTCFDARFRPGTSDRDVAAEQLLADRRSAADNLDDDRILRSLESFVTATLRTNWYQRDADGEPKPYGAFMLDSARFAAPGPVVPYREIFVHSDEMEGIHVRSDAVARGGIRFSDRPEDYRTEVLGLMKTQVVKNALVVPGGAKGAFVRKTSNLSPHGAYSTFVRGMLDLVDNIVDGQVVHPERTVVYGGDDTYLVVAADKGTARFSDLANSIAAEYDYWLGDAFASGGSSGYDHKEMGITARGAWVAVREHFVDLGTDVDTTEVTVVGIGDMSGDVFGNGMLLSPYLRLVGAFDHRHIFLDPEPDVVRAYAERRRLFGLPGSSWDDFDREVLSSGGGVWSRSAKSITVPEAARRLLGVPDATMTPNELIKALLTAPVDLLWNGGVGTYVKASSESHTDAADPANDDVRVDASRLRCRVVGEGGNLGFTQRARIEFAAAGGRINADFIDNAAGVTTSDAEVNLKIALEGAKRAGALTTKDRDRLLDEARPEVARTVLRMSRDQSVALGLAVSRAARLLGRHERLIDHLESGGGFRRSTEVLPSMQELAARADSGRGLTRPEIAVLLARSKNVVCRDLLESDVPDDPFFADVAVAYFPGCMRDAVQDEIRKHPLRREIIATRIASELVDRIGPGTIYQFEERLGVRTPAVARAYAVVRAVFDTDRLWADARERVAPSGDRWERLGAVQNFVEHTTSWLLRMRSLSEVTSEIVRLRAGVEELLAGAVRGEVPDLRLLGEYLALADTASTLDCRTQTVAGVYAATGTLLGLDGISFDPEAGSGTRTWWDGMAAASVRDDLAGLRHELVTAILCDDRGPENSDVVDETVGRWQRRVPDSIARVKRVTGELYGNGSIDLPRACTLAAELRLLVRATER
ncbi:glutamate dehydrogenase [Rhodococcus rhodochrous]|uniref:NAD-glutamate dehydrogenase domain-containing protein n=1 Tax=Rhodococcus rhodochrous TaxID=1829 RepID=UPI000D06BCDB|nr:NAD-glutamate dehydrogenase domain-containing protein [Rhodococcus rhodochrous]AYA23502.1 glutamate dehydrogenase [Rhodococcus rhodochrous]